MVKGYRERFGPPPLAEHRAIISGMPKDVRRRTLSGSLTTELFAFERSRPCARLQFERPRAALSERHGSPVFLHQRHRFSDDAKFSEHDVGLPAWTSRSNRWRSYVYGALAAHILGYVGARMTPTRRSAQVHVLSRRCGREIKHRESDGRLSARANRACVICVEREGHNRRRVARRAAANRARMFF